MFSAQKVCSFMYVYSYLSFWGFWGLKKDLENWLEFGSFVYELTVSISDAMITAYSGVILLGLCHCSKSSRRRVWRKRVKVTFPAMYSLFRFWHSHATSL